MMGPNAASARLSFDITSDLVCSPVTHFIPLDNVDHADLRVALRGGAAFGDAVNQLLVMPFEFEQLQRDFPILFRQGTDGQNPWYAVVLTGFDHGENLFLHGDEWTTRAVPAVQQRGPFMSPATAENNRASSVWIDIDDPRVGAEDGQPLYLRHGGATPYLRHVTNLLTALQRGHAAAAVIYPALARHQLLKPVRIEAEIGDGLSYCIGDVFAIDDERLSALDAAALHDLHACGALRIAFMASASLSNVAQLIERKQRSLG